MTRRTFRYTTTGVARPKKLDALTRNVSGRITPEQDAWLRVTADLRFDGEFSRTLRWAIEQAQVLDWLLHEDDPVRAMDEMLHPEKYGPPTPAEEEDMIREAEKEMEAWRREQAVKRAQRKLKESPS